MLLVLPYEPAAFMQADVDILSRRFELDVIVHNRGKLHLGLGVLRRVALGRPDVVLMWFIVPSYALAVTLLARLFRVKVAFITGGYDVVGMPGIGFGAMRFPLFRAMLRPTLALADLVLPFSRSAAYHLRRYGRPRRCRVVYPGVDTDFFSPGAEENRETLALTVSPVTEVSISQKGLRTFVEAARYAPDIRWVLVGRSADGSIEELRRLAGENVEFIDRFLSAEELRDLYRRASCYVQASVHEGFGVAVAEAMACGSMPVVTRRFSLPEVTGGLGEYVPLGDPQAVASAAQLSLLATAEQRREMRRRVVELYPMQRRERELVQALLGLFLERQARS